METLDEVASYFEDEIERIVEEEERQLKAEIEELRAKTKKRVEASANQSASAYKKQKNDELQRDIAMSKSEVKQKYYKELSDVRRAIGTDVFTDLKYKLVEYTKSSEYEKKLIDGIRSYLSENVVVYVSTQDEKLVSDLDVQFSSDIQLGGFIVKYKNSNRLEDRSLDSKVLEQEDWFYENSGLEEI